MDQNSIEHRIRSNFARQGLMRTFGAAVDRVAPRQVDFFLTPKLEISQPHGLVHAVAVSGIADAKHSGTDLYGLETE